MDREQIQEALSGPVPSIRTPFKRDGSIDYGSLRKMVEFDIEAGFKALLVTGGDSLYTLLSDAEIADLNKAVVEYAAGRAVVVACTDSWPTGQAVEFATLCREAGADIVQVAMPFWYEGGSTVEAIVEHYVAAAAVMPVMANSAQFHLHGESTALAAVQSIPEQVDNVIAIKMDVTGEYDRKVTTMVSDKWTVLAGGQKSFHMELLPYGCQGYLSTFCTFWPEITQAYWRAITSNDIPAAITIIEEIDRPYFDYILPMPGGFDAGMHGVAELVGLAQRWRRPPYHSLTDDEMTKLGEFMDRLKESARPLI